MGNYRFLEPKKKLTEEELLKALNEINDIWFWRTFDITVCEEGGCHIFNLVNEENSWNFQIWLDKNKITLVKKK